MGAILSIARTTLGEAIRRRVLLVILMIGLLLLSIIPALGVLTARAETSTMIGTMYAVLRGTSALIAIVLTVYMIPNEIERRTIYTILSKPVTRWQFLLGKYLGAVFALALMIALMSAVMLTLFYILQQPEIGKLLEVAKQPILYLMEMSLLAAVAICLSTFVTPLVNFFITIGVWMVGTVLSPMYESIATNSKQSEFMATMAKIITSVVPNFSSYDVKNPIINPTAVIQNETMYYLASTGYGLLYIAFLLILGIIIFDRREV